MGRLVATADTQAKAEYGPQIGRARREGRATVRSIRSSVAPLQAGIATTEHQLRHAGLNPSDLRIALSELAHRNLDVAASAGLQATEAQQATHGELVDLRESEGQAARSALATLQHEALTHRQSVHDEIAGEQRALHTAIAKSEMEKALGLGDYRYGSSGLTPKEQQSLVQEHQNAGFYAKTLFQAIKEGAKDKQGNLIAGPDPKSWSDKTWQQITASVAGRKGVNSVQSAEKAVQAIRDHVQPPGQALGVAAKLGAALAPFAAAVAPKPLQPVAQFGASLLRGG
jgi:hypothetical protein